MQKDFDLKEMTDYQYKLYKIVERLQGDDLGNLYCTLHNKEELEDAKTIFRAVLKQRKYPEEILSFAEKNSTTR